MHTTMHFAKIRFRQRKLIFIFLCLFLEFAIEESRWTTMRKNEDDNYETVFLTSSRFMCMTVYTCVLTGVSERVQLMGQKVR